MRSNRSITAIENWIIALNDQGRSSRVRVEAVVHPEIRIHRYGFGSNTGRLVEEIRGLSAVSEWIGLTPAVVEFELASEIENESDESDVARVDYRVLAGDFVGSGHWRYKLHDDGRLLWLEHRPANIPDAIQEGTFRRGSERMHGEHPHQGEHHHHHH